MILIIAGPPGVGKTTVASLLQSEFEASGRSTALLDSDQFSRRAYDRMYEQVVEHPERDWIIAATFYKREWQERYQRLPNVYFVTLWATLETCLARNRMRQDPISKKAVRMLWWEFDIPDCDLTIDVTRLYPDTVVDRIEAALETAAER